MVNPRQADQANPSRLLGFVVRTVLSLLVSALFVWLSLRKTDLRAVVGVMWAAPPFRLLAYFVLLLIIHLVRTVRWGILLEPAGHVGFRRVNSASAIGFMLLMVMPLRLGEFARPLLVARTADGDGSQLRRSATFASLIVERVVDGLAIAALGIIALWYVGATGAMADFALEASWIVGGAFLALCGALIAGVMTRQRSLDLVQRVVAKLAPRWSERSVSMVGSFLDALNFGSASRIAAVLALTVAHWGLHVIGFIILAPGFGFDLKPLMAAAVLASQAVGVMVPAGPGMIGTSQFFTQAALSIFVPGALTDPEVAARAAGYANSIWMLQFSQQVLLGLVFWFAGRVSLSGLVSTHLQDRQVPGLSTRPSITA